MRNPYTRDEKMARQHNGRRCVSHLTPEETTPPSSNLSINHADDHYVRHSSSSLSRYLLLPAVAATAKAGDEREGSDLASFSSDAVGGGDPADASGAAAPSPLPSSAGSVAGENSGVTKSALEYLGPPPVDKKPTEEAEDTGDAVTTEPGDTRDCET